MYEFLGLRPFLKKQLKNKVYYFLSLFTGFCGVVFFNKAKTNFVFPVVLSVWMVPNRLSKFAHKKRVLNNEICVVFYDMSTFLFEVSDEDDLRKTGFSKDGKHSNPQIFLGLLIGLGRYTISYDIFKGNTNEGHTLIPFIEKISKKFKLQPILKHQL